MTPLIFVSIVIDLALAGAIGFLGLRLATRRAGSTAVAALFFLAIAFGIVAIASVTFFRKTAST